MNKYVEKFILFIYIYINKNVAVQIYYVLKPTVPHYYSLYYLLNQQSINNM